MKNQNKQESINKNRRKLLAVMLIGSGTFLVEKVVGPLFSVFLSNPPNPSNSPTRTGLPNKTDLGSFKVAEDKKILSVYDDSGEEVFQIDKET